MPDADNNFGGSLGLDFRPRPHEDDCKRKRSETHIFISVHTKTIFVYVAFLPVQAKTLVNA